MPDAGLHRGWVGWGVDRADGFEARRVGQRWPGEMRRGAGLEAACLAVRGRVACGSQEEFRMAWGFSFLDDG